VKAADKVIITCAVTGSVHTPSMSPYLPVTPDEIVKDAVDAAEAGASILHLHARDPQTGRPTPKADVFMQYLPRIKQQTDAVINITTGGASGMSIEERLEAPRQAAPELCSLNMGSMNFNFSDLASKPREWKHDWEKPFLESTRGVIMSNTFAQIDEMIRVMGDERGARFEFECYDVGHLYTLADFIKRGRLKPPYLVQFIFGVLGGIGADFENLMVMKQTADRLLGADYYMSCFATGRSQMPFLASCAAMGGMVRVGLEDSLYIGKGQLARSNAEQVAKIRRIVEELGLEVASPADARRILALKGADAVAF
jgi:uncharacterized protein (DUF849 family)